MNSKRSGFAAVRIRRTWREGPCVVKPLGFGVWGDERQTDRPRLDRAITAEELGCSGWVCCMQQRASELLLTRQEA